MTFSGLQLRAFTSGWAVVIGSFGVGHYFRRVGMGYEVVSACGLRSAVPLIWGIGEFEACRKCRKKHGPPSDRRTFLGEYPARGRP